MLLELYEDRLVKTLFKIIKPDIEIRKYGEQNELDTRVVHTENAGY